MSYNRCKDIHKFGNKYLPLAYKTQVEFTSHFSGKGASYGPRNMVLHFDSGGQSTLTTGVYSLHGAVQERAKVDIFLVIR